MGDILDLQNLEWVQEVIEGLQEVVGSLPSIETSAQHGRRDWLERNALYCAIRTKPSLPADYLARYRQLPAHYLFAHAAWLVRNAQNPSVPANHMAYESHGGGRFGPLSESPPTMRVYAYEIWSSTTTRTGHRSFSKNLRLEDTS
jgi:hypothetical protein